MATFFRRGSFNYEKTTDPGASVNPPIIPCSWLNMVTGKVFLCRDNAAGANVWVYVGGGRILLTEDTDFYVATTGSDSTGDGSSGSPWLTIQHAYDTICQGYDQDGYTATINVAAGTYDENITLSKLLTGTIVIDGAGVASTSISPSSGACFTVSKKNTYIHSISNLKMTTTNSNCIAVSSWGELGCSNIEFGSCGFHHIAVSSFGRVSINSDYTISGSATYEHINATDGGSFYCHGRTVTLTGTPAFRTYVYATYLANVRTSNNTYSGSATGKRYEVTTNSVVNTWSDTLPGDTAGTTATGGQYT